MEIRSTAFSFNSHIPEKYTCEGENVNPPLEISGFPDTTKTIVIIVEDPDAPGGTFDHWLLWNINPNEPLSEKFIPGISGRNDFGKTGYGGPCPPSGTHRYFFKAFALDCELDLLAGSVKEDLLAAMKDHVLDKAELVGLYKKHAKKGTKVTG